MFLEGLDPGDYKIHMRFDVTQSAPAIMGDVSFMNGSIKDILKNPTITSYYKVSLSDGKVSLSDGDKRTHQKDVTAEISIGPTTKKTDRTFLTYIDFYVTNNTDNAITVVGKIYLIKVVKK